MNIERQHNICEYNREVFFKKYKAVLTREQFDRYLFNENKSVEKLFSKSELEELETKRLAHKKLNDNINKVASLNNDGIELEKIGDLEQAIEKYEECFNVMINNNIGRIAWHSPDRLRVLYKKLKHPNEREYLERAIKLFKKYNSPIPEIYINRLKQLT